MTTLPVRDLGDLDGDSDSDIFVWGGGLSNLHAVQALRAEAERVGIPPARVICTGDLAGYCANPAETVALVRNWGCAVLAGNVERSLAAGAGDCGCGFPSGSACDLLSVAWYAHADRNTDLEARAWMAALPGFLRFTARGRTCAALHGGATDISRFLWPDSPESAFREEIAAAEALLGERVDMIFAGHSGIPFRRRIAGRDWVNGGAAGLPPHDGAPATRFVLFGADGPKIVRLAYDHAAAADAMREAGLTQGYDRALTTGWWPSEDILPPTLRRRPQ